MVIYRGDFGAQWTIYPGSGLYSELWNYLSEDFIFIELIRNLDEIASKENIGTETVNEMLCDVYLYTFHEPLLDKLAVYRAVELDCPIKIELEAKGHRLTKEYSKIKGCALEDSLFTLPPGSTMLK